MTYIYLMEYLNVLRCGGWVPDPADRVRAVVVHRPGCPARTGGSCRCVPRVVLINAPRRTGELDLVRDTVASVAG
jgi:hypothetical protein